jgi:membrane protein
LALLGLVVELVDAKPEAAPPNRRDSKAAEPPQRRAAAAGEGQGRGRMADSPEDIPASGWLAIAKRTYAEIGNDRVLAVAAGVAFYGLLALFPAISAFVSLFGLFNDPATISADIGRLSAVLPTEVSSLIVNQVERIASASNATLGLAFFFSLGLALWSATGGTKALIDALNVAYGETEKRSFIKLTVFAILATLGAIVCLGLLLAVVAVVPAIIAFMALGAIGEWLLWAGRWPAVLLFILGVLALVYHYGPSRAKPKWRWVTPGSLVAGLGLVALSMLFSWYAASFGKFNETYGSLGAVIAFMTWLWLSSVIVLVGAELNSEAERQTFKDSTEGPPKPIGRRGANAADEKRAA